MNEPRNQMTAALALVLACAGAAHAGLFRKDEPRDPHAAEKVEALAGLIAKAHPEIADAVCFYSPEIRKFGEHRDEQNNVRIADLVSDGGFMVVCGEGLQHPALTAKDVHDPFSIVKRRYYDREEYALVYEPAVSSRALSMDDLEKAGAIVDHEQIRLAVAQAKRELDQAARAKALSEEQRQISELKKKLGR